MQILSAFACVVLCATAVAQRPDEASARGVIYGTVFDQSGNTAKEIELTVDPLGVGLKGMLPHTTTDQNGHYRFNNIPWWGGYAVFGDDEPAGYSQAVAPLADFHGNIQEVTLSPEHPEAEFNLYLPAKAGFLEIHLTNRQTGKAIQAVQVTVLRADDPTRYFSLSCLTTRAILVPPDTALLLHVTSAGFREWSRSAGGGLPIRVGSDEHFKLDVELDPSD